MCSLVVAVRVARKLRAEVCPGAVCPPSTRKPEKEATMSVYYPERKWPRLIPENAVMVSVFQGGEQAYGLIANLSEAGACVVAGVHFEPGKNLLLRIGFDPEGTPFTTQAAVVWSRDESESAKKPTFVHGIKFVLISEEQRAELKNILSEPDFHAPVIPGMSSTSSGLDEMMIDLNEDLNELGDRIFQKIRTADNP